MPLGVINITLQDGGLGVISGNNANQVVAMGVCSKTNTPAVYSFSQPEDVIATLGQGPLPEDICYKLNVAGGSVLAVPVNASVAGVISAWTPARVGTSNGTVSTSAGTPYDGYKLYVKVVSTGTGQLVTGGNVAIQVSLDNGTVLYPRILVPTSGTVALTKAGGAVPQDTGLTIALSASTSTFDAGDVFTATCQAPYYSSSDLAAAFTVLLADPRTWGLCHVVGYPTAGNSSANATASGVMVTAVGTAAATAFAAGRDARYIVDIPPSADSDIISAFASVATTRGRVFRAATTTTTVSVLTGAQRVTPYGTALTARLASISASHSPGVTDDGPLPGVVSAARDERANPGLYDQGFETAHTVMGRTGVYCSDGRSDAPNGSDFTSIPNCRVIDLVLSGVRVASEHFKNQSFQTDDQGHLAAVEVQNIQNYVASQVQAMGGTEFSKVFVSVYSNDNILSTQNLRYKVRVRPFAYAHDITVDVGFVNPSLSLT